jgi:YHS domain-containing protein
MKSFLTTTLLCLFAALPAFAQETEKPTPTEQAGCPDCNQHADDAGVVAAPKVLRAQTNCPITGDVLEDRDTYIDYEGHRIYVCCKKCVKKVNAAPAKVAHAMYVDGVQLENLQTTCAVSGKKLENRDKFVRVYNKRIYVCSNSCKMKAAVDPSKYIDVLAGRHAQEKCAVKGGKVSEESPFVVQGVLVKQCCPSCETAFRADPAAHFAKLEKAGAVVEQASKTCMVMVDKPTIRTQFVTLGSRRYFFCCEPCVLTFMEAPEAFLLK